MPKQTTTKTIEIDIGDTSYQVETQDNILQFSEHTGSENSTVKQTAKGMTTQLDLSKLPNINKPEGQALRLYYLNYLLEMPQGKFTDADRENLTLALCEFQDDINLPCNGSADAKTLKNLAIVFGA